MGGERTPEDNYTIESSLMKLREQLDENSVNFFNINRRNVLDGALRALRRSTFQPNARISVAFADFGKGEGAVDAGGPKREFFRLAVERMLSSSVFAGTDRCKYLAKCSDGKSER